MYCNYLAVLINMEPRLFSKSHKNNIQTHCNIDSQNSNLKGGKPSSFLQVQGWEAEPGLLLRYQVVKDMQLVGGGELNSFSIFLLFRIDYSQLKSTTLSPAEVMTSEKK